MVFLLFVGGLAAAFFCFLGTHGGIKVVRVGTEGVSCLAGLDWLPVLPKISR